MFQRKKHGHAHAEEVPRRSAAEHQRSVARGFDNEKSTNVHHSEFFKVGTVVYLIGMHQPVMIQKLHPVKDQKVHDYCGLCKIDGEEKKLYFDNEDIEMAIQPTPKNLYAV